MHKSGKAKTSTPWEIGKASMSADKSFIHLVKHSQERGHSIEESACGDSQA